jgi:hypothetical protein
MTAWFEAVCLVMMQPLWMKARQSQNMIVFSAASCFIPFF